MLKMAKKLKARAAESERKTAAAAAEVAAEAAVAAAALAEQKNGDPEKPPKSVKIPVIAGHDVPPEKLLSDKERKKLEKKLLEQRKKEEKKREKERKKLEKMMKKKKKNVPESQSEARGPEVAAAATAATAAGEDEGAAQGAAARAGLGEGAAAGGTSRAWAQWDTDSDEDDAYYAPPRVGGVVWRPGPAKAGALSAHMPLVVFLVFSIRSPSWVLNFLLQRRTEQGRGCGFVFGATCCFRVFLGCAFFSFLSGRTKRRGRGHGRSRARGTGRRGRDERLI